MEDKLGTRTTKKFQVIKEENAKQARCILDNRVEDILNMMESWIDVALSEDCNGLRINLSTIVIDNHKITNNHVITTFIDALSKALLKENFTQITMSDNYIIVYWETFEHFTNLKNYNYCISVNEYECRMLSFLNMFLTLKK